MDIATSYIWIIIFFNGPFEYGDGGILKLLRWMQHLHQSTWDHETLYTDRSTKDKQLLVWPLLRKTKNMNKAGSWKLKFTVYGAFEYGVITKFWGYVGTNAELLYVHSVILGNVIYL
jgi:hypothetical protein